MRGCCSSFLFSGRDRLRSQQRSPTGLAVLLCSPSFDLRLAVLADVLSQRRGTARGGQRAARSVCPFNLIIVQLCAVWSFRGVLVDLLGVWGKAPRFSENGLVFFFFVFIIKRKPPQERKERDARCM